MPGVAPAMKENKAAVLGRSPRAAGPLRPPLSPMLAENKGEGNGEQGGRLNRAVRGGTERNCGCKTREKIVAEKKGCLREGLKADGRHKDVVGVRTEPKDITGRAGFRKASKALQRGSNATREKKQIDRSSSFGGQPKGDSDVNVWRLCQNGGWGNARRLVYASPQVLGPKKDLLQRECSTQTNIQRRQRVVTPSKENGPSDEVRLRENADLFDGIRGKSEAACMFGKIGDLTMQTRILDDELLDLATTPAKELDAPLDFFPGKENKKGIGEANPLNKEKNPTPPMQPTSSPDFVKRGSKGVVPVGQGCFAAGQARVKDRRKCKPKGVLTVDAECRFLDSTESDIGCRESTHIPVPAVASVEWVDEDDTGHVVVGSGSSIVRRSMDLCRTSFQKLSVSFSYLESHNQQDENKTFGSIVVAENVKASSKEHDFDTVIDGLSKLEKTLSQVTQASPLYGPSIDELPDDFQCRWPSSSSLSSCARRNILCHKTADDNVKEDIHSICLSSYPGSGRRKDSAKTPDFEEYNSQNRLSLLEQKISLVSKGVYPLSFHESIGLEEMGCSCEIPLSISNQKQVLFPVENSVPSFECLSVLNERHSDSKTHWSPVSIAGMPFSGTGGRNATARPAIVEDEVHHMESQLSLCIAVVVLLHEIACVLMENIRTETNAHNAEIPLEHWTSSKLHKYSDAYRSSKASGQENKSLVVVGQWLREDCSSLLRGFTIGSSLGEDSSSSSECSVNQPSPLSCEDCADSSLSIIQMQTVRINKRDESNSPPSWRSILSLNTKGCTLQQDLCVENPCRRVLSPSQTDKCNSVFGLSVPIGAWVPGGGTLAPAWVMGVLVGSYMYLNNLRQPRKC